MTVMLVTGGTGTLGRRLVRLLTAAGHDVRVLSHSGAKGTIAGDLRSGEGVSRALTGAEVVVHCASKPARPQDVDVAGTRLLVDAAHRAGVGHLIYPSIVGIELNQGFPLYRAKLAAERSIAEGPVPWTILRATQFHEFVEYLITGLDRVPLLLPVPRGVRLQPVAVAEVAQRLTALAAGPPCGRVPDLGGPQVRTFADLTRAYLDSVGHDKAVVELPVPGSVARSLRAGAQLTRGGELGRITWEEHLEKR